MAIKAVWGPYQCKVGWKIVVHYVDPNTGESSKNARREATQEEAEALKQSLLEGIEARKGLRITEALEQYREHLQQKGNKPSSIGTTLIRLRDFMQDVERPVAGLSARYSQALYEALTKRKNARTGLNLTPDTHRNMLAEARTFCAWLVEKQYLDQNPLATVKGVGRRSHGKSQLRLDEARAFMGAALGLARGGSDGAVAALVALVCGLRAGEIVALQVRDIDDNGRVLVVGKGKTKAAARRVGLPDVLQPLLAWLAQDKQAGDRLFPHDRKWVNAQAGKISAAAKVPKVTAHGLRGVCATVATDAGQIGQAVAASLGHENQAITRQAYIIPGTVEQRGQRQLLACQNEESVKKT